MYDVGWPDPCPSGKSWGREPSTTQGLGLRAHEDIIFRFPVTFPPSRGTFQRAGSCAGFVCTKWRVVQASLTPPMGPRFCESGLYPRSAGSVRAGAGRASVSDISLVQSWINYVGGSAVDMRSIRTLKARTFETVLQIPVLSPAAEQSRQLRISR